MNWSNLKNNKCPKCSSSLKDIGQYFACTKSGCIFSINKPKFEKIVNDLYKPKPKRCNFEDNLSQLNNLGHDTIEEDFIDTSVLD